MSREDYAYVIRGKYFVAFICWETVQRCLEYDYFTETMLDCD